ncbi:MAG: hypothetical protein OEZ59_08245 [Deltaproteobacteria bacterium]|nr:hypothetical protein [Deltaproteobacteria bacterium]
MNRNQQDFQEFSRFVESTPRDTRPACDRLIEERVRRDICPRPEHIWVRMAVIQGVAGAASLAFCPQFGLGLPEHVPFLHAIHQSAPLGVFYFICGILFMAGGALLSCLLLTLDERRVIRRTHPVFHLLFSAMSYGALMGLGTEGFVLHSLLWIAGAFTASAGLFGAGGVLLTAWRSQGVQ